MMWRKLVTIDADFSTRMRMTQQGKWWWKLAVFLAHSGDSWFWAAGLGLTWLISDGPWRSRAALLCIGVVGLAFFVLGIKFLIRRQRPPGEWGSIYRNTDPHSFPSGHAARAFMLAVAASFLGPPWFGILLLVWAPLVSIARVFTGVHYLSDVVAGAVLGSLAGWLIVIMQPLLERLFPFLF